MGALREVLAKFGFDVDTKKLDDAKTKTDDFATRVKNLADKFAGGSLSGAVKDWISDVKDAASEFKGLAKLTGTSAEDMQRWTTAAKLSGSSVEALATGFRVLQKNASQAASGAEAGFADVGDGAVEAVLSGKQAQAMFKALGVDVKDANGEMKSTTQIMGDVGLELAKIKNPAERAALATKLFGRQGAALIPLFAEGEEGLRKYLDRIDELGGGVSEKALKALSANKKASQEYEIATLSLKSMIVAELLPAMTKKVQLLTDIVVWFNKTQKGTEIVRSGLLVLAGAILYTQRQAIIAGIRTAIAWAPTILLFAALALIVDDLWTAFKGGDSVIGKFIDKLFGAGAAKATFGEMGKDVDALGKKIEKLPTFGDQVEEVFSTIGASLVKFFVDDLPEAWEFFWADLNKEAGHKGTGFVDFIKEMFGNLLSWFWDWTKDLVKGIIDGIANGLKNGWSKVTDTFKELGDDLIKDFKSTFKINSPSRVLYKLTEFLPAGSVQALADWAPRVRDQAEDTFAPLTAPFSGTFAPVIRVPTVNPGGPIGPMSKHVDMKNEVKVIVQGSGSGAVRDAARDGVGLAFDDERRAMLAALEDIGG